MREKKKRLAEMWILGIMMAVGMVMAAPPVTAHAEEAVGERREEGGNLYWYENGVKQGTEGRGKEIYDPGTNAWYWLDAVCGGRRSDGEEQRRLSGVMGRTVCGPCGWYGKVGAL